MTEIPHHHNFHQALLNRICRMWPDVLFTAGVNEKTGRYSIHVYANYARFESGSNIPAVGAKTVAVFEVEGSSEKDLEVLFTKIAMVCG